MVRRILAHALDVPKSKIRVIKPRIGGGFGAKQTVVAEVYPAIVTMKTGKPAKIIYSRYESQIASSPRHEMEVKDKGRLRYRYFTGNGCVYIVQYRCIW